MNTTISYDGPIFSGVAPDGPYRLSVSPMPPANRMETVVEFLRAAHPSAEFSGVEDGVMVEPRADIRSTVLPRQVAVSIGAAIGRPFRIASAE